MAYKAIAHKKGDVVAVAVADLTPGETIQARVLDESHTVTVMVRQKRPRPAPGGSRPLAWGRGSVPGIRRATPSAAAFERSSSGMMATWLRTPTVPFFRRYPVSVTPTTSRS